MNFPLRKILHDKLELILLRLFFILEKSILYRKRCSVLYLYITFKNIAYDVYLVLELASDNNYLKRMTMLFCINELCKVFYANDIENVLLPTIIKMAEGRIITTLL